MVAFNGRMAAEPCRVCSTIFDVLSSISHSGEDPALIVSSNGLFKIFATSIVDNARRKKGTGHLALLKLADARCDVLCWNLSPDAFTDWVRYNV